MLQKYFLFAGFLFFGFSCSKENVRVHLDDAIGVTPEVSVLDASVKPFQITEVNEGWIFCQEDGDNFMRLDRNYEVAATANLPGRSHWIYKVPLDQSLNGNIYHLFVDGVNGNQLLLNEVDANGVNVSLILIGSQFNIGVAKYLEVLSDSILFMIVDSKDVNSGDIFSGLYTYNLNTQVLDTLTILEGYGHILAFNEGMSGYWLSIAWKGHPYHTGGSVFLIGTDGEVMHEHNYAEISWSWYFNNRLGSITESQNGDAHVFAGLTIETSEGLRGALLHLNILPNGSVEKLKLYPETLDLTFLDYYKKEDKIYILSQEKFGTNPTKDMVIQVFSNEGELLYAKYIRNTHHLEDFAAITEVNEFHATVIAYDKGISQLVKLTFSCCLELLKSLIV